MPLFSLTVKFSVTDLSFVEVAPPLSLKSTSRTSDNCLGWTPPEVVNNHMNTLVTALVSNGFNQGIMRLCKTYDYICTKSGQGA